MVPVIMCGGRGTRLWPVSRSNFPKPFCNLLGETLFNKTFSRLKPFGAPWVLTTKDLRPLTEVALRNFGADPTQVVYEPFGRNTAPAIALLCRVFQQRGWGDRVVGVFPADHLIEDQSALGRAVALAEKCAETGQIVTLGIEPTYAATGYGYIERDSKEFATDQGMTAYQIKGFHEKPSSDKAESYLKSGNHFWNAGIFFFRVSTMIEELRRWRPKVWSEIASVDPSLLNVEEVYQRVENVSIDYAVMEKSTAQVCIPCRLAWTDVGSWEEVARIRGRTNPAVVTERADGNFVHSEIQGKAYGLIGVQNLMVIDTEDALLLCREGESQGVKQIIEKVQPPSLVHERVFDHRPWGRYEILADRNDAKVKVIDVLAGQQLSYQSHSKREEHWVVVDGSGIVVLDDKDIPVRAGVHVHIPRGSKHRIRNTGMTTLRFIEVQLGTYFGEDDIVRFEDDYKRV